MYNRYVQGHDGTFRRQTMGIAEPICPNPPPKVEPREEKTVEIAQQQRQPCRVTRGDFDLGDLLLLCIIILLLIDSEEEDSFPIMIVAAIILFLQ